MATATSEHTATACSAASCTEPDDHPKIHVGPDVRHLIGKDDRGREIYEMNPSFHFDCLPERFEAMIADGPQHATTRSGIAAARAGVHGDDLRAHLFAQPNDNAIGHGLPDGHADKKAV